MSGENLVRLPGASITTGVNQELVEMIEELLARARSGEIVAAAWVAVGSDGTFHTRWKNGGANNMVLPAGIGRLFTEYLGGMS